MSGARAVGTYGRHPAPPALPEGAVAFLAARPDKPGRLAVFMPNGSLSQTFGTDETADDIVPYLAAGGFRLGDQVGDKPARAIYRA